MDPKLTILFIFIGAVIALSNLGDEPFGRLRQQFAARRWRELMLGRRKQ